MKIFLVFLFVSLILTIQISYESGFQKELDLNIPFPPILDRREGIPTGHLRPLGWQNRAEAPIKEEDVSLEAEVFWDKYINRSQPVVIRGLLMGSEAVDKWSDIYLNRAYGHLDIKVTQRKQTFRSIEENKTQMTLKKFLQNYRVDDWYLRCIMPEEMQHEASIAHLLNCGPYVDSFGMRKKVSKSESGRDVGDEGKSKEKMRSKLTKEILSSYEVFDTMDKFEMPKIAQLIEPYLWITAGETSSLLHSHPEQNLHCVLDGRKDFILIPTSQFASKTTSTNPSKKYEWRKQLDLYETYANSDEWYSKIDVDMVNAFKYKILHVVKWYWSSLRAGDCIFIPAGYLHQIRSYGRGISTSVYFNTIQMERNHENFGSIKSELFQQCDPKAPLFQPLTVVSDHFLWTYTHSERHLNKKTIKFHDAKLYLLYLLRQDEKLFLERFQDFFDEITLEIKKELDSYIPSVKELIELSSAQVWADFYSHSETERSYLTLKQIANLKTSNLARFIKILNLAANFHDLASEYKMGREEL